MAKVSESARAACLLIDGYHPMVCPHCVHIQAAIDKEVAPIQRTLTALTALLNAAKEWRTNVLALVPRQHTLTLNPTVVALLTAIEAAEGAEGGQETKGAPE